MSPFREELQSLLRDSPGGAHLHSGDFELTTLVVWLDLQPTLSRGMVEINRNLVTCFFQVPEA